MLLVALLFLGGTALWCLPGVRAKFAGADSRTIVNGTLPHRDLAEIRRVVWHELRRGVTWRHYLPDFSRRSLQQLPTRIRSDASRRIVSITLDADGTVTVQISVKEPNIFFVGAPWKEWLDLSFRLKKGQTGWQIISTTFYSHCYG